MRPKLVDLRALQSLVVVAEIRSMVAAARRLNYSQSAISMQLQRLERSMGCVLLQRETQGLQLTAAGKMMVHYGYRLLRLNADLHQSLSAMPSGGVVRVGVAADLALLLETTWAVFARMHADVEIEVRAELSAVLARQLSENTIDLAVLTLPGGTERGVLLRRAPLVWVGVPAASALSASPLPLALGPDGRCEFRRAACEALGRMGRACRVAFESQTFASLVAMPGMVSAGLDILSPSAAGLPELPAVDIRLCERSHELSQAAADLAGAIRREVC